MSADDVSVRMHLIGPHHRYDSSLELRRDAHGSSAVYHVARGLPRAKSGTLEPQLPWDEIWKRLGEAGFFTLPDENATPECETEPVDVDAEQIVVDIVRGGQRHHFTYGAPLSRRCPGALRLMQSLRFLQEALAHPLPFP